MQLFERLGHYVLFDESFERLVHYVIIMTDTGLMQRERQRRMAKDWESKVW